jgi:hypothetical protein
VISAGTLAVPPFEVTIETDGDSYWDGAGVETNDEAVMQVPDSVTSGVDHSGAGV